MNRRQVLKAAVALPLAVAIPAPPPVEEMTAEQLVEMLADAMWQDMEKSIRHTYFASRAMTG